MWGAHFGTNQKAAGEFTGSFNHFFYPTGSD